MRLRIRHGATWPWVHGIVRGAALRVVTENASRRTPRLMASAAHVGRAPLFNAAAPPQSTKLSQCDFPNEKKPWRVPVAAMEAVVRPERSARVAIDDLEAAARLEQRHQLGNEGSAIQ